VPPRKSFTNGLFRPLTDQQFDMLEREYYTNKNMVGRDKLYFILKRKYGDRAPTQKAINDWLINQKVHQLHRRQFKSQTITPIRNVRVPNQMWQADLVDMGSKPDNGYKWILTVVDIFSKYAYARAMRNKEKQTVATAMADILRTQKPRLLQTDNGSEFIASNFQALLRRYNVKHITGLAGRAFSQGNIERWNGTVKAVIGRLWTARKQKKWVADLPQIVDNYINLWSTVYPDDSVHPGARIGYHNHPGSFVSCVIYLQTPEQPSPIAFVDPRGVDSTRDWHAVKQKTEESDLDTQREPSFLLYGCVRSYPSPDRRVYV
jgi:transposase InsO family protein